ncbi:hypothetical protein SAMN05443249_5164 [Beijerinckia sp. 28-YEA-48]|nr:hypothetical protein SAMN05443249_5164 [Beijerinckia sp. 28-YEA-48]
MTKSKSVAAALFGVAVMALAGGSAMAQSYRTDTYSGLSSYDRAQQRADDMKELSSDAGLAAHRNLLSPQTYANQGRDRQFIGRYNQN